MANTDLDQLIQSLPPTRDADSELRQALRERDWDTVLHSFSRGDGWDAFKVLTDHFESAIEYWKALAIAWMSFEKRVDLGEGMILLEPGKWGVQQRRSMMNRCEQFRYDHLPDRVSIYRGAAASTLENWSWTLDRDIAKQFAYTGGAIIDANTEEEVGVIVWSIVSKSDLICYLGRKDEEEVIIDPRIALKHEAGRETFPLPEPPED